MIVFFVYNILIFNYKDSKNYRDYQLFKRISYPELRFLGTNGSLCVKSLMRFALSEADIVDVIATLLVIPLETELTSE